MATPPIDILSIYGMGTEALLKKFGKPARVDVSEYGFNWYVYNQDLKNFFMVGVQEGQIVAAYSNAKTLSYGGKFKLAATRSAVQNALGKPQACFQQENCTYMLLSTNEADWFAVGNNYHIAFFDLKNKSLLTALLIVPVNIENGILAKNPTLNGTMTAASARLDVDLVNSIRVRSGLKACTINASLNKLALYRSNDMKTKNYFSHYAPDGTNAYDVARKMGIRFRVLGENIAQGMHNSIFTHEFYMNSTSHRANILNSAYHKIGTGMVSGGPMYTLYTETFTD